MVLNDKSSVKLAVFDLDGTLVDSKYDLTDAVNFARQKYGFAPLKVEEVASYLGSGITALVKSVLPKLEEKELENAVKIFKDFYCEHLLDKTKPYDKVSQMLSGLKTRKVVLSNKTELFSKKIIENLGLKKYFEEVYGGDSFKEKKPSPVPIFEIMRRFSLNKENIVMVGDGANDIGVGKNAGIRTVGVLYGYSSKQQMENLAPDYTAQTPENVTEILRSL